MATEETERILLAAWEARARADHAWAEAHAEKAEREAAEAWERWVANYGKRAREH
jgi:hypothetical protein